MRDPVVLSVLGWMASRRASSIAYEAQTDAFAALVVHEKLRLRACLRLQASARGHAARRRARMARYCAFLARRWEVRQLFLFACEAAPRWRSEPYGVDALSRLPPSAAWTSDMVVEHHMREARFAQAAIAEVMEVVREKEGNDPGVIRNTAAEERTRALTRRRMSMMGYVCVGQYVM